MNEIRGSADLVRGAVLRPAFIASSIEHQRLTSLFVGQVANLPDVQVRGTDECNFVVYHDSEFRRT